MSIGTTGYVTVDGAQAASVKQFKGCDKNWSSGTNTLSRCTHAVGSLPDTPGQVFGRTTIRC